MIIKHPRQKNHRCLATAFDAPKPRRCGIGHRVHAQAEARPRTRLFHEGHRQLCTSSYTRTGHISLLSLAVDLVEEARAGVGGRPRARRIGTRSRSRSRSSNI